MRTIEILGAALLLLLAFVLTFVAVAAFAILTIALVTPHVVYCKATRRPTIIDRMRSERQDALNLFSALFLSKGKRFRYQGG